MNSDPDVRQEAFIYARVSSKEQEREGYSIPAQLDLLRGYASEHGYHVVSEYVDVETAKKAGRTGFEEMLGRLEAMPGRTRGPRAAVLVEKTDRLYRNISDWATLDPDRLGLEIHFVKEGVVLAPEARSSEKFVHGIKVLMAKNYIDNLSEETSKGMRQKASQGYWPCQAPLGYMNVQRGDQRVIEPDPDRARHVQQLFQWYATGEHSLSEVTRMVNDAGLRSPKSGHKVQKSQVHRIVTNPLYCGRVQWKGEEYEGSHEPLISRELYDRAQTTRATRGQRRTRKQKHDWAFRGMLRCGHCDCAMTAEIKKGKYVYYHCTGNRGRCPEKYVREEEVARQFGEAVAAIEMDDEVLEWVVEALRENRVNVRAVREARMDELVRAYNKLQRRLDAMYEDKLDGEVSREFYERKRQEWGAEQRQIEAQKTRLGGNDEGQVDDGIRVLELAKAASSLYMRQDVHEKARLVRHVCSNSPWRDGTLHPEYRKPFDLLAPANIGWEATKAAMGAQADMRTEWFPR